MKDNPSSPVRADLMFRHAVTDDVTDIELLVERSMAALLPADLTAGEVAASRHLMGVDRQLIADGTYLTIWCGATLFACGGWSHRATLFGSDATAGRNSRDLDPHTEPARVRAMYTHPDWTRQGLGRLVLSRCEDEAAAAGFRTVELAATRSGAHLYRACGYQAVEDWSEPTPDGIGVPLTRMRKPIGRGLADS
mgnify:CR=1 FL=1